LLEESLVIKRGLGDRWSIANSLESLARAALHLHDLAHASAYLTESLTLRIALEDKSGLAISLAELAGAAAAYGNFVWAARLFAAAEALMKSTGTIQGLAPGDQAEYSRTRAAIEHGLTSAELATAEAEGLSLLPEQILAQLEVALAPVQESTIPIAVSANGAAVEPALTARETEVLRLIVDGLSYIQIAEKLIISSRTVDAHLRSIYSKLQVRSRHEATRYALENRLVDLPR
jgi:DNA-binding NarL/FixJ family response regulator